MNIKNERGSVSILALFMLIVLFAVGAFTADVARHFCIKVAVKYKLNLAGRSAAAQVDESKLADTALEIDEARAAQAFLDVLKVNLILDDSLAPQSGSILNSGPVNIEYFKVVKAEELPFSYTFNGHSETVEQVGVVTIISFPVKSGMFAQLSGAPDETTMYCKVTTAPELISRPVSEL